MRLRWLLIPALLLCTGLQAQSGLPSVSPEGYGRADLAAKAPKVLTTSDGKEMRGRRLIAFYSRLIKRDPTDARALASRAYALAKNDEIGKAEQDYLKALEIAEPGSIEHRYALWSFGWTLFQLGRDAEALARWQEAERLSGGNVFWAPYTYALPLWRMGHRDLALGFYDAAVRSNSRWGNEMEIETIAAHWNEAEREVLKQVFIAWRDQR